MSKTITFEPLKITDSNGITRYTAALYTQLPVDKTLQNDNQAADAKITGEKINELNTRIDNIPSVEGFEQRIASLQNALQNFITEANSLIGGGIHNE